MRTLFIGDIIGKPGRVAIQCLLPMIIEQKKIDYIVANGENAAGGFGLTSEVARKIYELGVHGMTLGNHLFDQRDTESMLDDDKFLARPANLPPGSPGRGYFFLDGPAGKLCVINIQGRVFMTPIDCPFRTVLALLPEIKKETNIIIIDFHAEASSEKQALGFYLDGQVSAIFGTHTHVQTSDERILPGGTGFITDVGMTGPYLSVIGMEASGPIAKMVDYRRNRFEVATEDIRLAAVIIDADNDGKCKSIERLLLKIEN